MQGQITVSDVWPCIELSDFILQFRLPVEFKRELIVMELRLAAIRVQALLKAYSDANEQPVKDSPELTLYYWAVFTLARGHLGKHFVTLGAKQAQDTQADMDDTQFNYWLDQSDQAIRDLYALAGMTGQASANMVELI